MMPSGAYGRYAGLCVAAGLSLASCAGVPDRALPPDAPAQPTPVVTSPDQQALAAYYKRTQSNALARGLLRTDGGGPDTPFDTRDILENFERIAFYDEYKRGQGFEKSGQPATLAKWDRPIRYHIQYGDTVGPDQRSTITTEVDAYFRRLGQITGHAISHARARRANFTVIFAGLDDQSAVLNHVTTQQPNTALQATQIITTMPRSVHCLVMAFSNQANGAYSSAIALIRAEHPDLQRRACIHEELAQGMGLANDSPQARPSVFNDDDEFATLTAMDQTMLQILYDPRLTSGMTLDQARPILTQIGDDLSRPNS